MFIVHWYVTWSKALVSGILSLAVPNLEGKVQGPIDRVCKINSHIRENLHYGEVQWLVCFIRNKPMGAVSPRENLVLVWLDLFTRVWAVRFVSTAEIALPQIKLRAAKVKKYDLQSVCSTCKNVLYMYRTFSVAVSVAVMLLKKGSVTHLFHTRRVGVA